MPTSEDYLAHAAYCRQMAHKAPTLQTTQGWIFVADTCDRLAQENAELSSSAILPDLCEHAKTFSKKGLAIGNLPSIRWGDLAI